jgi:hypothetical protein
LDSIERGVSLLTKQCCPGGALHAVKHSINLSNKGSRVQEKWQYNPRTPDPLNPRTLKSSPCSFAAGREFPCCVRRP